MNPVNAGPCYCCALNITNITVTPSENFPSSFTATWDYPEFCNRDDNQDYFELITQWPYKTSSLQYHKGVKNGAKIEENRYQIDEDDFNIWGENKYRSCQPIYVKIGIKNKYLKTPLAEKWTKQIEGQMSNELIDLDCE